MSSNIMTGAKYVLAYLTGSTTDDSGNTTYYLSPVGMGANVSSFSLDYKTDGVYGIGGRYMKSVYSKGFEGKLSFTYILDKNEFILKIFNEYQPSKYSMMCGVNPIDLYLIEGDNLGKGCFSDLTSSTIWLIHDFVPDSLKVEYKTEEYVTVTLDGVFTHYEKVVQDSSHIYDFSPITDYPFTFANLKVSFANDWNSTNYNFEYIKDISVNIKNNLEKVYGFGQQYAKEFVPQKYEIDVDVDLFVDRTTYEQFMSDLSISGNNLVNSNFDGISGDYYPNENVSLILSNSDGTFRYILGLGYSYLENIDTSYEDANIVELKMKIKSSIDVWGVSDSSAQE